MTFSAIRAARSVLHWDSLYWWLSRLIPCWMHILRALSWSCGDAQQDTSDLRFMSGSASGSLRSSPSQGRRKNTNEAKCICLPPKATHSSPADGCWMAFHRSLGSKLWLTMQLSMYSMRTFNTAMKESVYTDYSWGISLAFLQKSRSHRWESPSLSYGLFQVFQFLSPSAKWGQGDLPLC